VLNIAPIIEVRRFHIAFVSKHCLHRLSKEKDLVMGGADLHQTQGGHSRWPRKSTGVISWPTVELQRPCGTGYALCRRRRRRDIW